MKNKKEPKRKRAKGALQVIEIPMLQVQVQNSKKKTQMKVQYNDTWFLEKSVFILHM